MSALIVIPARGGSKGIPRKNLRLLAGRPLMAYAVTAALHARCGAKVVVSTDDPEIAECARGLGADVLWRPAHLSLDEVPLDPVIVDAAERVEGDYDTVISVQATSPLVTPGDIDAAYDRFHEGNAGVVFTVTDDTHITWGIDGGLPVPLYSARVNRQSLPRRMRETGAVVCTARDTLLSSRTRFVEPYSVIEVEPARAIDIDDHVQWAMAEAVMAIRHVTIVARGVNRVSRQLTLASGLTKHRIRLVLSSDDTEGLVYARERHFAIVEVDRVTATHILPHAGDVVVLDLGEEPADLAADLTSAGCTVVHVCEHRPVHADGSIAAPPAGAGPAEILGLLSRLIPLIESSVPRATDGH